MTKRELKDLFKLHHGEFLEFDRVANKRSKRPDLHAFMLLDELCPGEKDIVSAAEHDEIFLAVEVEDLAKVITEDQVIELTRCGIRVSSDFDCLCSFV